MGDEADNLLLERARAGDAQAIETLLERHQDQIYRFGMKMCRDPEDAKDVLQDTLLSMARGVRDFRGASSISTWLYTIARSFCIKKRRRSKFAPDDERSLDTEMIAEGTRCGAVSTSRTTKPRRRGLRQREALDVPSSRLLQVRSPSFAGCGAHVEQVLGNRNEG